MPGAARPPFLLISSHDARTPRRASVHFIVDELARLGPTRFFSAGFSALSLVAGDPRTSLLRRANRTEAVDGVECFLWLTPLHPFNPRHPRLDAAASMAFRLYARLLPPTLRRWIRESRTILIESGLPLVFAEVAATLNPRASLIYLASDDLGTIGCAPFLSDLLARIAPRFDWAVLPSPALADVFPPSTRTCFVPHGLDRDAFASEATTPFEGGINAVSVGSMLFDPDFFRVASDVCPDVIFHVIGGGLNARRLAGRNIRVHAEMAFAETLPFLRFADLGIAPYDGRRISPYLADTSMKLMQFGHLGLPALCPTPLDAGRPGRFGYVPGDAGSIEAAIRSALAAGRSAPVSTLTWREATDRILDPARFPDTVLQPAGSSGGGDVKARTPRAGGRSWYPGAAPRQAN